MKKYFIIIPSLSPTGPIKGAIALANAIASRQEVTLVVLKSGSGANAFIDKRVRLLKLYRISSLMGKMRLYKKMLKKSKSRSYVASISFAFSADFFNVFFKKYAMICSSVRGNLPVNYYLDYGFLGKLLALFHLLIMRRFDYVATMTCSMSNQVEKYIGKKPYIIGNFIDEPPLKNYVVKNKGNDRVRVVFVGSLSQRKNPDLLIDAANFLVENNHDVSIDVIGDGPLRDHLKLRVLKEGLNSIVKFHGQLTDPYTIVANANVFVLPSASEGVSRASLEALYLGVPVVLRNIDGNSELVVQGENGFLFDNDVDFPIKILETFEMFKNSSSRKTLLPKNFRQEPSSKKYMDLFDS